MLDCKILFALLIGFAEMPVREEGLGCSEISEHLPVRQEAQG